MKTSLITMLLFSLSVFYCTAQTLELKISNPQPRLGQSFTISVDIDTVSSTVFSSLSNKFKLSTGKNAGGDALSAIATEAVVTKTGRNKIGPFSIDINGKKYSTNAVEFDIVDSLPAVDKGFWIRTSRLNDSTVLVLTDQRIPALTYYDHTDNALTITKQTNGDDEEAKLNEAEDVENAKVNMQLGQSEMQSIQLAARELNFKSHFWVYKVSIIDKSKPVVLHKAVFKNIPNYYNFKDIKIN
jgi:hypothetical protein